MRQVKHILKPHYLPIFYIPVRVIRLYDIQTSSAQCHVPNFPKLFACTGDLPIMDFVVSIHAPISFFRIPVGRKSSGVFYLHTVIINGYAHRTSGFFVRPMLKNGVPSEATLCRMEYSIDNSALANRMQEFAKSFRRLSKEDGDKEIICVDGKAKRSTVQVNERKPDIVSAYSYNTGITLATEACREKNNEIIRFG